MNLDFKLVEDALLQFSQIDCCPSTSACSVTFVIRVSKRYADAFASRPDIRTRAGLLAKLGRDFHPDDPMCDYLGDWQPMAVAAPRGTETIVFQGTIERVKEVLTDLVQDVWLPRRTISKTAQVHVPLCDANTALASSIPKGEFSKIAEDSAAVIAFEATPQGSSFYQATVEGDRDSLTVALVRILELLRPPEDYLRVEPVTIIPANKRARTTRLDARPLPRRFRRVTC